jgi:hypothetical protein
MVSLGTFYLISLRQESSRSGSQMILEELKRTLKGSGFKWTPLRKKQRPPKDIHEFQEALINYRLIKAAEKTKHW